MVDHTFEVLLRLANDDFAKPIFLKQSLEVYSANKLKESHEC